MPIKRNVNQEKNSPTINVAVTVGLIHTVAKAIYASTSGKIREAVANAIDNKATWMVILADRLMNRLIIFDNGHGITENRFMQIFKSIGFGMLSEDTDTKLSYFGLGLMSVIRLGDKVKLYTKPKGYKKIHLLEVDTKSIFDPTNEKNSISTLKKFIKLSVASEKEIESFSSLPLENFINENLAGKPTSFTEIIIEGVGNDEIDRICEPDFIEELCRILPLRLDPEEPFLAKFPDNKGKAISAMFKDKNICPTIDIYFGVQGETIVQEKAPEIEYENNLFEGVKNSEFRQLWKYFPKFRGDLVFPDSNVLCGVSEDGNFAYYVAHTTAKDLYRETDKKPDPKENGLWVRNQNFLVKSPDFLEKPGPGRPIISMPVRGWIFGEIFHKNMNHFLTVSRTEYLFENDSFINFRSNVHDIVKPLDKDLRSIWTQQKKITEEVIKPFSEISRPGGIFKKTEDRLRKLVSTDYDHRKFKEEVFNKLKNKRNVEIETATRIENVLEDVQEPILLGETDELLVQLDPEVKASEYHTSWNSSQKKVTISLSPKIFTDQSIVFLDEKFDLLYVVNDEEASGMSIDAENKKIYINPFNRDICKYSVTIIDVLVAMEFAYIISNDMPELKDNFLKLMEIQPFKSFEEIITPLGDDLRRRVKFRN